MFSLLFHIPNIGLDDHNCKKHHFFGNSKVDYGIYPKGLVKLFMAVIFRWGRGSIFLDRDSFSSNLASGRDGFYFKYSVPTSYYQITM